jgi:hypothetical protein
MTELSQWVHRLRDIPESGLDVSRRATPEERAEIAKAIGLVECRKLEARYTIRSLIEGRYLMHGSISAQVVQSCVVTLEPVESDVSASVEAVFWPAEDIVPSEAAVVEVEDGLDPEPIIDDQIEAGRVIYEHLADAIDPYPRKPGVTFDWKDGKTGPEPEGGPFAALGRLKNKP